LAEKSARLETGWGLKFYKFGMLFSRHLATKLKCTLQMDMSYATIPMFGQKRRLHRENQLAYMVSILDRPNNYPIYVVDTDIEASIFYNNIYFKEWARMNLRFQRRKVKNCRKSSFQVIKMMWMMGYGTWI
jgi:hypothetical protein